MWTYRCTVTQPPNQDVVVVMLVRVNKNDGKQEYARFVGPNTIQWQPYQAFDLLDITMTIPGEAGAALLKALK